jgi:DNA-directed RNA polymerase subunit beta
MPKDVAYGKTIRKSFAKTEEIKDMPNLLEVQKDSYKWFLETGLREVFRCRGDHRLYGKPRAHLH